MKVKDFREMKIKKLMKDRPDYDQYIIEENEDLSTLSEKIRDTPFQMVVVIDNKKKVKGIVTAWDMADKISSGIEGKKLDEIKVMDYVNRMIYSISENDTVDTAIHRMNAIKKNKIIVENEKGEFVGVLHKSIIRDMMDEVL